MGRAPCCDKNNVKRGPWSPEEDAVLKSYIDKHGHGGNWIALPQKAGLKRCGKSCRLRWLNYLRPDIKHGGFTDEEDNIICSLYQKLGSRWSVIASHLPGRTDNDVKNYWNTKLKKKLTVMRQDNEQLLSNDQITIQFNPQSTLAVIPSLPPPNLPIIKDEVYGHIEDFSKTLQSNYAVSNGSYRYYCSETQPYTMMSLLDNRTQVVSPPLSDEISAASSSVTIENGNSNNSLMNWNSSDDVLFCEISEFLNPYGDTPAQNCYFPNFTNMLVSANETKQCMAASKKSQAEFYNSS